jgi:hypothetical protein
MRMNSSGIYLKIGCIRCSVFDGGRKSASAPHAGQCETCRMVD